MDIDNENKSNADRPEINQEEQVKIDALEAEQEFRKVIQIGRNSLQTGRNSFQRKSLSTRNEAGTEIPDFIHFRILLISKHELLDVKH